MTRNIIITACVLGIGTSLGFAEDKPAAQNPAPASSASGEFQLQPMQLFDSSMIENKRITDASGKDLGKLERLLIDSQTGIVRFVVVQVDKEWSLNDPEVIIPWGTLQISRQGEKDYALKIDTDRDKLMKAPHFDKALVHQLTSRASGAHIYSYWGVEWRETQPASSTAQSGTSLPPSTSTTSTDLSSSGTSSATSTSPATTGTTSTAPGSTTSTPSTSTPTTTTDGSVGRQPLGNTGTSDSPKPDTNQGQSRDLNTEPLDPEYETGQPDRQQGGNQTD